MSVLNRFRNWIGRGLSSLASVVAGPLPSARADENAGWDFLLSGGSGPADRPWSQILEDLTDTLEAWRKNFIIRRIVTITTSYVVGGSGKGGIEVTSKRATVERWVRQFWTHDENRIATRLTAWCDEITRSGELFIALSAPSRADGMSFIRAVPACSIRNVRTDPDDLERPLEFEEIVPGKLEPKVWKSKHTATVDEPLLLHFAFNRVVGAVRGESDLTPVLPLARRYTGWLRGRVQFNDIRNKLAVADVEVDDDSQVEAKRQQYAANPPTDASIFVHGKGERLDFKAANVQGWDAEPDGRAQRLAIAAGSNYPLHFFGEGSSATRSTAKEMGGPTHSFLRIRQADFARALVEIVEVAYRRAAEAGHARLPASGDLRLDYSVPDVSEQDNIALSQAGAVVVRAFDLMRRNGWITDDLAVKLSFKFFGEILTEEEIQEILDWSEDHGIEFDEGSDGGGDDNGDGEPAGGEPADELDEGDELG